MVTGSRYWNAKRVLQGLAVALALLAGVAVLFVPSYASVTSDSTGIEVVSSRTVWDVNSAWFLLVVAAPVLISAAPMCARGRFWPAITVTATILLTAFAIVGSLSIGYVFLPAVLAELASVFLRPRFAAAARA